MKKNPFLFVLCANTIKLPVGNTSRPASQDCTLSDWLLSISITVSLSANLLFLLNVGSVDFMKSSIIYESSSWSQTDESKVQHSFFLCRRKHCIWEWHLPVSAPSLCTPSPPSQPWCLSGTAPHSAPILTGTKTISRVTTALRWMWRKKQKSKPQS